MLSTSIARMLRSGDEDERGTTPFHALPRHVNPPAVCFEDSESGRDVSEGYRAATRDLAHLSPEHKPAKGRRSRQESLDSKEMDGIGPFEAHPATFNVCILAGRRLEPSPYLAKQLGSVSQSIHDCGVKPVNQMRNELCPNPISGNRHVVVSLIVDVLDAPLVEVLP
jgi:hypothetical protein